jgi:hypothetical protein
VEVGPSVEEAVRLLGSDFVEVFAGLAGGVDDSDGDSPMLESRNFAAGLGRVRGLSGASRLWASPFRLRLIVGLGQSRRWNPCSSAVVRVPQGLSLSRAKFSENR